MKIGRKQQVIMSLIKAVSDNDKDRIQSFFSDESKVRSAQGSVMVGQEAIWDAIAAAHNEADKVDWEVDQLHEDEDGSVQTEGRIRYLIGDQWREVEVKGAFEVCGSKVMQWQ